LAQHQCARLLSRAWLSQLYDYDAAAARDMKR
jgi:hypothetical protein